MNWSYCAPSNIRLPISISCMRCSDNFFSSYWKTCTDLSPSVVFLLHKLTFCGEDIDIDGDDLWSVIFFCTAILNLSFKFIYAIRSAVLMLWGELKGVCLEWCSKSVSYIRICHFHLQSNLPDIISEFETVTADIQDLFIYDHSFMRCITQAQWGLAF